MIPTECMNVPILTPLSDTYERTFSPVVPSNNSPSELEEGNWGCTEPGEFYDYPWRSMYA